MVTQRPGRLSFIHIGLALAINGLRTMYVQRSSVRFERCHRFSAANQCTCGRNGHHWMCMCVSACVWGSEGESGLVSNVIETNKINANYLVFQFVTLHYSAQLINAGFFHASALATYLSLCFFLAAPKHFPQYSLMPSHRVDLLIVLFHINFI